MKHALKVVAFNGSSRKDGNTAILLSTVLSEIEAEGIQTELVQFGPKSIPGCIACYKCKDNLDRRCAVKNDPINECIEKMIEADGIVIGSPTYFSDLSSNTKSLIDRAGMTSKANGDIFRRKVGAAVVAVRRAGAIHVFDSINHFFTISQMIIVGSSYWNIGIGRNIGEVEKDEEGIQTMKTLGKNMAWVIRKLGAP
jgi:multimeric flavodoxin WrbA